ARETRATTGAPRTVHGQRPRRVAGTDGVSPLRGGRTSGGPRGPGPVPHGLRRDLQQPPGEGFPDRRDHRPGVRLRRRGRAGAGPDGTPRRRPRRPHVGCAGGAQPRVRPEVPRPAGGGTLGVRRGRDRRGGHGPLRGGDGRDTLPPPRGVARRRRLARGLDAGFSQGPLRGRGAARNPQGRQRLDHPHRLGPQWYRPGATPTRLHGAPNGPERPGHHKGRI
ncbi:MAG: Phosphoglycerate mutase, partial [uncultured Rubrobacteraceae bacterium]